MNAQKIKIAFVALGILLLGGFGVNDALAGASATVSWIAPTTNEDASPLTDLTGYRVYYRATTSTWLGMTGTCLLGAGTSVSVSGGTTLSYFFNNTLTPGTTYYFTVVATDGTNVSACGKTTPGNLTEVSKRVSYSGDLDTSQGVGIFDYNILKGAYGTAGPTADIDKDGSVGIFDYNILKADYGLSFT